MKKIEVLIQKGDNRYEAVINPDKAYGLDFVLFGEGETVQATIEDFHISRDEMKEVYEEDGRVFPQDLDFAFKYDLESFFEHYSKIFSMPALESLTGINQKQLHHYASGLRKPREPQKRKIENALHKLGNELISVAL